MANPPITIGPFTNVPAPGSPIRSDWTQAISTFVSGTSNTPNIINGAADPYGHLRIEGGYLSVSTDANGQILLSYGGTGGYSAAPVVLVSPARGDVGLQLTVFNVTAGSAQIQVRRLDTHGVLVSESAPFYWVAIGRRA